jgi:hypothetical protein
MRIDNLVTGPLSQIPSASLATTSSFVDGIPVRTSGTFTLSPGANTVSLTFTFGGSYQAWIKGNVPNGICMWNGVFVVANSNVPVLGEQYSWYFTGNGLVWTSLPNQLTGTNGSIVTIPQGYVGNSNIFSWGITNNTGATRTINWGYIRYDKP